MAVGGRHRGGVCTPWTRHLLGSVLGSDQSMTPDLKERPV